MKKFNRLPPDERKAEIQTAALALFSEKGFSATTMENIVERVTLSKGGVYRLYPSTAAILSDIMIQGMRLRNAYYESCVTKALSEGQTLDLPFMVDLILDSLTLYPEISTVYVEFLWEKQRNPDLEALYQNICHTSAEETAALVHRCGADRLLPTDPVFWTRLTDIMNAAELSLHVLHPVPPAAPSKEQIRAAILTLLEIP